MLDQSEKLSKLHHCQRNQDQSQSQQIQLPGQSDQTESNLHGSEQHQRHQQGQNTERRQEGAEQGKAQAELALALQLTEEISRSGADILFDCIATSCCNFIDYV